MSRLRVVTDVTCTACPCHCDDVTLHIDGERLEKVESPCALAAEWFATHSDSRNSAVAQIDQEAVSFDEAIDLGSQVLAHARYPAIVFRGNLSCEVQRAALELADVTGSVVGLNLPSEKVPACFPRTSSVACSWGEIRDRADLILLWRCDPKQSLPRFDERVLAPARLRRARIIALDEFTQGDDDFATAWLLRAHALEKGVDVPESLRALTVLFESCKYGVVLHDSFGTLDVPLNSLARDLNRHRRFRCVDISGFSYNFGGDPSVMNWQTGYRGSITFHRGFPASFDSQFGDYHGITPEDYAAFDARVVINAPAYVLSSDAKFQLNRQSSIVINPQSRETAHLGQITITTAIPGIHTPGTVFRADGVALPLRPAFSSSFPDPTEVFRRLTQAVRARRP